MAGYIQKRGENVWQLVVTKGRDSTGKKRRFSKTVKCGERQAKKELALFVAEVEQKQLLNLENITLADFVEKWVRDYAEPHLTTRGLQRYKELLDRILQAMGHLKLTEITPLHIAEFYSNLREDGVRKDNKPGGLSQETIKHHHTVLKKVLNDAVKWDLLVANPVLKIQTPKVEKKEAKFYDEEQMAQLLLALEDEEIQFRVLVKLYISTGCRRAEVVAFQWDDIDFNNNEIKIERALSYTRGGQQIKVTKTEKSRKIALPESTIKLLKEYRQHQNKKRLKKGLGKTQWLFTGRGGELIFLDTAGKQFSRFVKKHSLAPITLQGLRHTHGTHLLAKGIDVRTVANRLGHSETSTTLDVYTHALKSADKAAANVIDQMFIKSKNLNKK